MITFVLLALMILGIGMSFIVWLWWDTKRLLRSYGRHIEYTGYLGDPCWYCYGVWGSHELVCGQACYGEEEEKRYGLQEKM